MICGLLLPSSSSVKVVSLILIFSVLYDCSRFTTFLVHPSSSCARDAINQIRTVREGNEHVYVRVP